MWTKQKYGLCQMQLKLSIHSLYMNALKSCEIIKLQLQKIK